MYFLPTSFGSTPWEEGRRREERGGEREKGRGRREEEEREREEGRGRKGEGGGERERTARKATPHKVNNNVR